MQEILRTLEQSSSDELYLETPQLQLIVHRGQGTGTSVPAPPSQSTRTLEPHQQSAPSSEPAPPAEPPAAETAPAESAAATTDTDRLVSIPAPLKGIFYRVPRPGAPPFVDVGSHVQEDTVVGSIEVIKLMHSVLAGVCGEIVQGCVENGRAVDRGQPLFLVRPNDDADETPVLGAS